MTLEQLLAALQDHFGEGYPVTTSGLIRAWEIAGIEVAVCGARDESDIRSSWRARQGGGATPLLLLVPADEGVAALGPGSDRDPMRMVPPEGLVVGLATIESLDRRDAVVELAALLGRLDTAGIPGVVIRGLLTRHILEQRLRKSEQWALLQDRASGVKRVAGWRDNLASLGWAAGESNSQGYLYRYDGAPSLVVHPMRDAGAFSRLSAEGTLPEGSLISDCRTSGARWGMLATNERYRLFRASEGTGSSTGRYLEIDVTSAQQDDWPYLGLLHADSLKPGGLLEQLIEEAERFGVGLRERLEDRLRDEAILLLSRGIGRALASDGADLAEPKVREEIEGAVLTLLFRLLFLFFCESQGYLPLDSAAYRPHALTTLARSAYDSPELDSRSTFYWDSFTVLVRAVRLGNRSLSVPAYNGDLFAEDGLLGACMLEQVRLPDDVFGAVLRSIGFDLGSDNPEAGVDYAGLEVEHLGRIYENLLSLRLSFAEYDLKLARQKAKSGSIEVYTPAAAGDEIAVSAGELFFQTEEGGRKAGGVYYTRQDVVRHLITHAVLPALHEHLAAVEETALTDPAAAAGMVFRFRVLDPAMGSAHFLADALDVIADEIQSFLAKRPLPGVSDYLEGLRSHVQADLTGAVEDGPLLRRLVLKHCIFGVDLSPMAVEVAKITLWLKSFVPGLALSYLNHNLRCGNSLVGVADDSCLLEDVGLGFLVGAYPEKRAETRAMADQLAEVGDRTPEEVTESRRLVDQMAHVEEPIRQVFDLWAADPLGSEPTRSVLQTEIDAIVTGAPSLRAGSLISNAESIASEYHFLHWPLAFPEVFAGDRPGFDVVVGNPPWEEVTVEETRFWVLHSPGFYRLGPKERVERVAELSQRWPQLAEQFEKRKSEADRLRLFLGPAGGYRLQGGGDTDLYQLFCERYAHLLREGGFLGVVLPRNALLADGSLGFRRWLFSSTSIRRLDFIINSRQWCFPIHPQYTIALVSGQRRQPGTADEIALSGPSASEAEFSCNSRSLGVRLKRADLATWTHSGTGPTWEVPLLPSDAAMKVYARMRKGPLFAEGYPGTWRAFPVRELDETIDRRFFVHEDGLPVWKSRCFSPYDPHGRDPYGFAHEEEVVARLQGKRTSNRGKFVNFYPRSYLADLSTLDLYRARVAFGFVSRASDSRTINAALVPPMTPLTNAAPYLSFYVGGPVEQAFVLGLMDSLVFDWQARRLVELNVNFFILNALALPIRENVDLTAIASRAARLSCVDERFTDFARAVGVDYGLLDEESRLRLMAEIDALVAHAYQLSEEDIATVMDDFTERAVPSVYRDRVMNAFLELGS